jgi:hypothetical protein
MIENLMKFFKNIKLLGDEAQLVATWKVMANGSNVKQWKRI